MNELQIRAVFAGLAFGTWPLIMNRSGLSGNVSSTVFAFIAFIGVLPFAFYGGAHKSLEGANWLIAIFAGLVGAFGLLMFNGMLAKATSQNIGTLFVVMVVIQSAIPLLFQILMGGYPSMTKLVGLVLAFIAAVLLTR